ncbi:MAG: hypothetical protein A2268_12305 [Candidatus Raymondbacteria bacterium RifOxyA12_full_50_37]|uniref:Glycoside hydrolase family 57 N-terminal domain-containing protein n=1 Tax=Candidatus Raymondbacteria bacterium RIFOXYD12_FULL_49_13 TaxID=1817890 RepID=A0A1F7F8Q9_UNCRA|nr:MAG: hypothetical protein A2350_20455 [Candidatus Raymondbacteria bacterium RifOxyB12_full_50_8]OGJ90256.1 MAG: hypothetical protein A2268_12305 [Candidatus Raymondbacteria bacterium RifOxyA12_full_50_37]OGJ91324.1 MAG: hypothetical protein A2248_03800 [Candidatus Raymondbacteria bacterium RIFOXYA2_FULL_49_16]OGJ97771.1 MAG: hypothetical protein A2453_13920 [Candidatus Raymondbacteria bacterium RIFOXYC2_FULL_50_21]OGK02917.1 MAG: hypothetical protein A2519_06200 [Candidatus Raymondbacteria b
MLAKTVYLTLQLHTNMSYDRYTKQFILKEFPKIYRKGIKNFYQYPFLRAQVNMSGVTIRMLQQHDKDIILHLKKLFHRGQIAFAGCQYACSLNMNTDEMTGFESIRLGLEVLRSTLDPHADGFMSQEWAYHNQLPWMLKQNGVNWMVVLENGNHVWPARISGLDGTLINTVAKNVGWGVASLEEKCIKARNNEFLLTGGDFEMCGSIEKLFRTIKRIEAKHRIKIEFSTFPAWLQKFGEPSEVIVYSPFGGGFENRLEKESFSKWSLKPLDIKIRPYYLRAMGTVQKAGIINETVPFTSDHRNRCRNDSLTDNPWGQMFESAFDFPEDEIKYLAPLGKPTYLSKAKHHLLIGVNSDAIGWAEWGPRWQHRVGELKQAAVLAGKEIAEKMDKVANILTTPNGLRKMSKLFLAFNANRKGVYPIHVDSPVPGTIVTAEGNEIPTINTFCGTDYQLKAMLPIDDFALTLFGVKGQKAPRVYEPFLDGNSIKNDILEVRVKGKNLIISHNNKTITLCIPPFKLSNPTGYSKTQMIKPDLSKGFCRTRNTPFGPQLEIFHETAWPLQTRLLITLQKTEILCEAHFMFYQPSWVGKSRNEKAKFNIDGLRIELQGDPGDLFYSIPFGVVKHYSQSLSYAAIHRFAVLQAKDRGIAVIPRSGMQGIRTIPQKGIIGIRLGASAAGECDLRPVLSYDRTGNPKHTVHYSGAVFSGHYHHEFTIRVYEGNWRKEHLWERSSQLQNPPYIRETITGNGAGSVVPLKLFDLTPSSVMLAGFCIRKSRTTAIVFETAGKSVKAVLRYNNKAYAVNIKPHGICEIHV